MRILITGATGFIGFSLARRLLAEGHTIVAAARRAHEWQQKIPAFTWLPCDFLQDTDSTVWQQRLAGVDLVINAVGIINEGRGQSFLRVQTEAPMALFKAASDLGVKVIQVSAMGADQPGVSVPFLRSKQQADNYLRALPGDSIILYPSIVIGRGGTSTALFNQLAAMPVTPLVGDGEQKLNPVHIDDLCRAVAHMVSHWPGGKQQYQLSGSEVLTMAGLYGLLRDWLRLGKPRFLRMPLPLMYVAADMGERFRMKGLLNRDALDLLQDAKTPAPDYLPCPPRSLRESLWLEPATLADTFHAVWSGIRPALFASIAFIWFFTALTSAFFDRASGYELLATGGITGTLATLSIYSGALFDFVLGVAMFLPRWCRNAYRLQIMLMLGYMVLIAFIVPAQWLHPFGPVTKNLPLIVGTWLLLATELVPGQRHLKTV